MAALETNSMTLLLGALTLFVSIGISSLVLNFVAKKLNFSVQEYKTALMVAAIAGITRYISEKLLILFIDDLIIIFIGSSTIFFIFIQVTNILINIVLIKLIYKEGWKNSANAGILLWVIEWIIAIILALLIAIPALYSMGVFSTPTQSTTDTSANVPPCINCFDSFPYINHNYDGSYLTLELRNGPEDLSALSCISPQGCSVNTSYVAFNKNFLVRIPKSSDSNQTVVISYKKSSEQVVSEYTQLIDAKFFR
jgi:hypothetical protein